jgi:hypothetical protein
MKKFWIIGKFNTPGVKITGYFFFIFLKNKDTHESIIFERVHNEPFKVL